MLGIQKLYEKNLVERLKFYELPEQLKYLPMALSANYLPAKSVSGAAGIWQLPYTTAKLHNLRIDSYVDDRYDIPKATETALTHLKLLYSIYHDWHLTLTAYTCGSASVNKAIRRAGGKTEYTNIYPFLPEGLRDIIPVFTVVSYLAQEYDKHNLHPADITSRFRVDSVTVTRPLQLMQASRLLNIPAEEIKSLNPVYKINVIPAWNASYKMALPPGNVANFQKLADSIYRLSDSIYFSKPVLIADNSNSPTVKKVKEKKNSRSKTETKSEAKSEKQTTKNATTEDSSEFYTVKKGESLGGVASKLKITVADIKKCNKIRKNTIFPGQKLKICR